MNLGSPQSYNLRICGLKKPWAERVASQHVWSRLLRSLYSFPDLALGYRSFAQAATRNLLSAAGPLLLPDKRLLCQCSVVCFSRSASAPRAPQTRTDLVFSGHVHAFERSLPIDGVQHFVVGHGGNRARPRPGCEGLRVLV